MTELREADGINGMQADQITKLPDSQIRKNEGKVWGFRGGPGYLFPGAPQATGGDRRLSLHQATFSGDLLRTLRARTTSSPGHPEKAPLRGRATATGGRGSEEDDFSAKFFAGFAGEEADAEGGSFVGAAGGTGIEEVNAFVDFVVGAMGVAVEEPVGALRHQRGAGCG